jgi:hypothetical protein
LRRLLAVVLVALVVAIGVGAAAGASRSPLRVTLTAQNHHPRASHDPAVHWWFCVKVTSASGKSVASTIHVQIVSGDRIVRRAGLITLRKGYDHWCQAIGGEASLFNVVPTGKSLDFEAVVTAQGVTVKRDWPIVVQ